MVKSKVGRYWYLFGLFLLLAPVLYNGIYHRLDIVFESSIYSLNYQKYFTDLFSEGSNYFTGVHSIQLVSYFVLYALIFVSTSIFGSGLGYFVVLGLFYLLGYHYLVRLLQHLRIKLSSTETSQADIVLPVLVAVTFFSSLAIFNFLKSNIIFLLPYLTLPAFIYYSTQFTESRKKIHLLPLLGLSVIATSFNLTHLLIIWFFTVVFTLYYSLVINGQRLKRAAVDSGIVGLLFLPSFIFVATIVVTNSLYGGSVSEFAGAITEDFYSFGARFLRIILQTTDWGLFGSWQGEPYYAFSSYYQHIAVGLLGLLPYLTLVLLLLRPPKNRASLSAMWLIVIALAIFQFMLGSNNPIYRYLYENLFGFQVFRNITKAAPLLLFTVLVSLFMLSYSYKNQLAKLLIVVTLAVSIFYNLPHWTSTKVFFKDRAVKSVPVYWHQTADYLTKTLNRSDRVLVLPASYIAEQYRWDGVIKNVQGHLLDALLPNDIQTYRIGEILIGPIEMQEDMGSLFARSELSARQKDVDYTSLTAFAQKYGMNYVVVSADLVSEYQKLADITAWLNQSGYKQVAAFGEVAIYSNSRLGVTETTEETVTRISSTEYSVIVRPGDEQIKVATYSDNWKVFNSDNEQVLVNTHLVGTGYRNVWIVDELTKQEVAKNGPIELRVYFQPAWYLSFGVTLSIALLLGAAVIISYSLIRRP